MEEFLDILSEEGKSTGARKERAAVHRDGDWHGSSKIWFLNEQGELLIQQRSESKKVNPLKWTLFTGGHITSGEEPEETALKESKEEIGVELKNDELKFVDIIKVEFPLKEGFEREFCHEYVVIKNIDLDIIKKTLEDEVQDVKYLSYKEIKKIIQENHPDYIIDCEARKMISEIEKVYASWLKGREKGSLDFV